MTGTLTGAMLALAVNAEPVLRRNGNATLAGPSLTHWPAEAAASLDAMIAENANQSSKHWSSPCAVSCRCYFGTDPKYITMCSIASC